MKKIRYFFGLLAFIFSISQLTQCNKEDKSSEKSKEASIVSFELGTYKGKLNGTSFIIEVPYAADISSLSAKVELSAKATIKPDPKTVKDWSNPVSFTVTAENGNTNKYTVTVKILPPVLTFEKLTKEYTKGGHLNATEILNHVKGAKAGYTLKEITNLNPNDIVVINGTAPNLRLAFNRAGVFTASLRLKHNATSDLDVTLSNAAFEIAKGDAPLALNWIKQSKVYGLGEEISNGELLAGLNGTKTGYTIKTVTISDAGGTGARVSGSGTSAKIVGYTKAGTLTLSIVFEHDTKEDKNITGGQFEITKASAPRLTWTKQRKPFSSDGEITNTHLLAGVTGSGKTGYTIKTVTIINTNGTGARVSGSGTSAKITSYTKAGTLTLTLVLVHDTKEDVTLRNAQFEITKASAPRLTWTKQRKPFSSSGEITNANLLAGVTGSGKNGYTIKTVRITHTNGTGARVSGSGRAAKITSYTKAGTLTLTIVLQHDTKDDVTLRNAQFEITKASATPLSWTKQTKPFSSGGEITNPELLAGVTGSGKTGYTIKTVTITNKNGTSATVSGSGRAAKITSYTKAGTLTLTLVLQNTTKPDVTLRNAQFEIYLDIFKISSAGEVTLKTGVRKNSLTTVTIPYMISGTTVTSIGYRAFKDCSKLTSITIPNSVTSIEHQAFKDCSSLTSITIPNSVTSIGEQAFYNCTSLASIAIPNSVTSIIDGAFYNCTSLASITIPNSVTSIGERAFYNCTSLASITMGNSVTSIESMAFNGCTSLTSITMGNSVTSIGDWVFSGCSSLTRITIPNSVTSIKYKAFYNCSSLTSITMGNSVTSIAGSVFHSCSSLTSITIPNSVTTIGNEPFRDCSKLITIRVPNAKVSSWKANLKKGNSASVVGY